MRLVIIFNPPDFYVFDGTLHLLYLSSVAKYKYSHSTLHQSPAAAAAFPQNHPHTSIYTHVKALMQLHTNTQTCPTLPLFTFYFLQPCFPFSLSSLLPSSLSGSSVFSSSFIMLTKPIKSLLGEMGQCYSFISAQRHLQTQKRGERRSEGRRGKRQRGENEGMNGKGGWGEYGRKGWAITSDKAKDERESRGGKDKMAGQQEQVDKDVIMINQQHVYTKLTLPLSPPQCIISFLWPAANLWHDSLGRVPERHT